MRGAPTSRKSLSIGISSGGWYSCQYYLCQFYLSVLAVLPFLQWSYFLADNGLKILLVDFILFQNFRYYPEKKEEIAQDRRKGIWEELKEVTERVCGWRTRRVGGMHGVRLLCGEACAAGEDWREAGPMDDCSVRTECTCPVRLQCEGTQYSVARPNAVCTSCYVRTTAERTARGVRLCDIRMCGECTRCWCRSTKTLYIYKKNSNYTFSL